MADEQNDDGKDGADGDSTIIKALPISSNLFEGTKRPYLMVIAGAQVGELHKVLKPRTTIGRAQDADIRIVDDGISRHHVEIRLEGDRVLIRDLGSTNGTFRNGTRVESVTEVADGDKVSVGSTTILKFTFKDGIDEAYESQLYRSATQDGLTHALKKEFFLERLEGEVAFAVRHSAPVALILWDLDRFKSVNDRYGHPAGDLVLSASARAVAATIRREDVFGRYGGEEFALTCRGTAQDVASRMAERFRRAIEETLVDIGDRSLQVTASFGVATCPSDGIASPSQLIAAADAAMYRAKAAGRNRVMTATVTRP
jgi:diguanylate cyclase (GGDEF)-like protein